MHLLFYFRCFIVYIPRTWQETMWLFSCAVGTEKCEIKFLWCGFGYLDVDICLLWWQNIEGGSQTKKRNCASFWKVHGLISLLPTLPEKRRLSINEIKNLYNENVLTVVQLKPGFSSLSAKICHLKLSKAFIFNRWSESLRVPFKIIFAFFRIH